MDQTKRVIALGFFDGVHTGHGALLSRVSETAQQLNAVASAFTFDRSPTAVITGQTIPLLSCVEDRVWLMRRYYGIQQVVVASFDAMQRMDWEDFIVHYLAEELGVVHVVAGHDFHFGYMGKGNPQRLADKCRELGLGCDIIGKVEEDGITISSTYIRTLVAQGEMDRAVRFLGHPHILTNRVVHGKKLGSSRLGFPTVNLSIPDHVIVPAHGVYATKVWFDGQPHEAVTNVGVRPTVEDNDGRLTVESFLLDFSGDLYGREIRVEFYHRLRGERKFPTLDALAAEIRRNAQQTHDYFAHQA
jgi:riboflavin kinase/FMN adenylyltransferase